MTLQLVDVLETGRGAPSRWSARTIDGRPVDVRLRHGDLTVRIGECGDSDARGGAIHFDEQIFKRLDSAAEWEEVAAAADLHAISWQKDDSGGEAKP